MISDNTVWVFQYIRKNKAFFERIILGGKVHLMATNRAARRFLKSRKIQNLSIENGSHIDIETYSIS